MAIDRFDNIIASSRSELQKPQNPAPGVYQQNAGTWWQATLESLGKLAVQLGQYHISSIAVDGTSSTVLLTDQFNQPLMPALMYNDTSAAGLDKTLGRFIPEDNITRSATSSLMKALFMLSAQQATSACRFITHQADWITSRLTGKPGISDENNCLKLGYDSEIHRWPEWMDQAPFDVLQKLPRVIASGSVIGLIDPATAELCGLPAGIKIISGTTDSTASTLATGARHPGEAVTTIGTTMVMKIISEKPVTSISHGIYSHRLRNGLWLVGGASNVGGMVLEKFFSVAEIQSLSEQIDPFSRSGLNFYPLPARGERFPVNDPQLEPRLEPRPDSDIEFLQAIFEGFAYVEKLGYELIQELGGPSPTRLMTAGGAAASNEKLTAIRESISGLPITPARQTEACFGSALIARQAI